MSKTVTVPSEATDEWAWELAKATCDWAELPGERKIAITMARQKISVVLSTAPVVEPEGEEVERVDYQEDLKCVLDWVLRTHGMGGLYEACTHALRLRKDHPNGIEDARAAIAAMGSGAVKVKPLEWNAGDVDGTITCSAETGGFYQIEIGIARTGAYCYALDFMGEPLGEFPDQKAAVEAAQADHDAKIRSALQETDHG